MCVREYVCVCVSVSVCESMCVRVCECGCECVYSCVSECVCVCAHVCFVELIFRGAVGVKLVEQSGRLCRAAEQLSQIDCF